MLILGLWKPVAALATWFARKGDHDRAGKVAALYAKVRPSDPKAWRLWAHISRGAEDALANDSGIDDVTILQEGLKRLPSNPELQNELGWALLSRFDSGEVEIKPAKEAFGSANRGEPQDPDPYLGLANIAHRAKDWDRANELIDEAERRLVLPEHAEAFGHLFSLLAFMPDGLDHLLAVIDRGLRSTPRSDLYLLRSVLLQESHAQQAQQDREAARKSWIGDDFEATEQEIRRVLRKYGPE